MKFDPVIGHPGPRFGTFCCFYFIDFQLLV